MNFAKLGSYIKWKLIDGEVIVRGRTSQVGAMVGALIMKKKNFYRSMNSEFPSIFLLDRWDFRS